MSIEAAQRNTPRNLAEQPISVGRFFKNRKGDIVAVQIKEFEGVVFCDIRQFFQNDAGQSCPTKKGVALTLRKLPEPSRAARENARQGARARPHPHGRRAMRKCDGCGQRNFTPAPMLRDEVWSKLADAPEPVVR